MNIEIELTEKDWTLAREVGERRLKSGKGSKGWGGRTVEQEAIGVIGEIVGGKVFNQTPKFVYGQSDEADLIIKGKKADVKTSLMKPWWKIENLHLLAHKISKKKDIYIRVFITHDKQKAILNGWTTREYMEQNSEDWVFENHHLFRLPNNQLSDIKELLENE